MTDVIRHALEAYVSTDVIEFYGEHYPLVDPGLMIVMDFAEAAGNIDADTIEGLIALKNLIRLCIREEDWPRFHAAAVKNRASNKDFEKFVAKAMQLVVGRPTQPSSDSLDGPPATGGSSTGDSSSPVVHRLEQRGRPDLALIVEEAQAAQKARAS